MKRSSSAFTRMVSDRIYFAWFPIGAQFVGDGGNKITTQSLHRASSHNNILSWPRKSNKTFDTCVHRDNQVQNSCHDCDRNERHSSELFFYFQHCRISSCILLNVMEKSFLRTYWHSIDFWFIRPWHWSWLSKELYVFYPRSLGDHGQNLIRWQ